MNRVNTIAVTVFMIMLCTGLSLKNCVNNHTPPSQVVEFLSTPHLHDCLPDTIVALNTDNEKHTCYCIIVHSHTLYRNLLLKLQDLHYLSTEKFIMLDAGRLQHNNGLSYYYLVSTLALT